MAKERPRIFSYLDYREFISDFCSFQRETNREFSLRLFSGKISPSLASSGLMSAVLKGKRNISPPLRPKFALAMNLKEKEAQYFELLVQFNQATEMESKNHYFLQLSQFRNSKAKVVSEGQYKYYSKWYYSVIWNFFGMNPNQSDPSSIAKRISPPLTIAQVEEAIRLLLHLKLIRRLANGYGVTENHITTEKEFRGLVAKQYNQQFINMAANMLDGVPAPFRQYNTLVFSISDAGFETIKERILGFQEELKEIIDRDQKLDHIYTLSMQLYPNTRVP